MTSDIQSILIHKHPNNNVTISKSLAQYYIKLHNFKPIKKVHETKNYFRFRIREPEQFKHFIIKPVNNTMSFVIGFY